MALGHWSFAANDAASKAAPRYPFRTDFTNAHLPWYRPQPLEFPPHGSERRISGELVSADFILRQGQFRATTGELMDFALPPYGAIHYRGAEADLRDVPLGTAGEFNLHQDADGGFTRLALLAAGGKAGAGEPPATEEQRKKFQAFTKARGLPGWIERTAGNQLTVTLFSGDPAEFQKAWLADFATNKTVQVAVANDELRTWNPPVDKERATVNAVELMPVARYGTSGVRLVLTVNFMLEGFRRGRVVRVFGAGWPVKDQFYGESLMGYGYGRLPNQALTENVAQEYPEQFPFRTDYGNRHLPWYQLKPGVKPPPFAEHRVVGELVSADAAARTGQFRTDRPGELVGFTLISGGTVKHLNAEASLADLPPGTRCRFQLFQDERGAFTRASLVSDEFSFLAGNAVTYRLEALKLAEGKFHVAQQLPEVKNYNGDMERPPDIGRAELLVAADTRVWQGERQLKLSDLAAGDVLLVNLTGEQPGRPSRCTDIWVGADTQRLATDRQAKRSKGAR